MWRVIMRVDENRAGEGGFIYIVQISAVVNSKNTTWMALKPLMSDMK